MRSREYVVTGQVDANGRLLISDADGMNDFFKKWPKTKFIGRFSVAQSGSSEAMKGYYYNKIVPDFKKARWENGDRTTEKDTEKWIREMSPIMVEELADEDTGEYTQELRKINDLDNQEMVMFIDNLKQIAAEEFGFFIEDPNVYNNG